MQQLLKKTYGDKIIWGVVILLSFISLLLVYSSTGALAYKKHNGHAEFYLFKQLGMLVMGMVIIYVAHRQNYTLYSKLAVVFFYISIPLLLYTLFFGQTINGGTRWVRFAGISFQTSDLAKLALFMYLARQLSLNQKNIHDLKTVTLKLFLPTIVIVLLIAVANLSTALMLAFTCCVIFFIGRVQLKHLSYLALTGIVGLFLIYGVSKLTGKGRAETWENRISTFFGSSKEVVDSEEKKDEQYQILQAKIAIVKGSFFGRGPGNSTQRNFLPLSYADMIYAIIIEEYGLFGGIMIVFLYMLFLWRSIMIFKKCPYAFGAFLAIALSFTLVFQALLNIAVCVNLVPTTGLVLPLISMGGSSIWFTGLAIGIILSVSKYVEQNEGNKALEVE